MLKPRNIELILKLEAAITGLNEYGWEFPFGTILWEVEKEGAFTIEKNFKFEIISEDKIGFGQQQHLEPLLDLLHRHIIDFTIYNFSFSAPDAYKVGYQEPLITENNHPPFFQIDFDDLIIGKTQDNYWIGIIKTPNISVIDVPKKQPLSHIRASSLQNSTKSFLTELENLLSIRYSHCLFEIYPTHEGVLERIFNYAQIICSQEFDGFEQRLICEIERFKEPTQNLSQVLQKNLIKIREYRLCNYYVYFIGQTHWGDWAGVWTQEFL